MKQVFKVIFRYDEETEDFLKWASKYCKFMRGPDQRGRGYGIDASEQKALRKELEAKFGTIEMARQTLAQIRAIYVYSNIRGEDVRIQIDIGYNADGFERAIEWARQATANWYTGPVYHVGLASSIQAAERMAAGREHRVEKTYISSNVFAIDIK